MDFTVPQGKFHQDAKNLIHFCGDNDIEMATSVLCVGTFVYLIRKRLKLTSIEVKNKLTELDLFITLVPTHNRELVTSAFSSFKDLEDAILYFTAVENQCDAFITQNTKDFPQPLPIPVLTPAQFFKK